VHQFEATIDGIKNMSEVSSTIRKRLVGKGFAVKIEQVKDLD
jgi:hypothetical protein